MRQAIQLAVDPKVVLELGYNNLGKTGENHHVCPIHPEYADTAAAGRRPGAAWRRRWKRPAWTTPSSS